MTSISATSRCHVAVGFWGFCTKAGAEVFCGQSSFSIACTLMDPLQIAAAAGEENFYSTCLAGEWKCCVTTLWIVLKGRFSLELCQEKLGAERGPKIGNSLPNRSGQKQGAVISNVIPYGRFFFFFCLFFFSFVHLRASIHLCLRLGQRSPSGTG
ncbi:hypothetical protein V8C34DRAFT_212709 [Trichoderma compactum]